MRRTDFRFKEWGHKVFSYFCGILYIINMLTLSQLEQHLSKAAWIFKAPMVMKNEHILENGAALNISQYVSRLEVKDDAPKQTLEELIEMWKKNREELYDGIKNLI